MADKKKIVQLTIGFYKIKKINLFVESIFEPFLFYF